MLHIDDCVPGTIVQLDAPFKPGDAIKIIHGLGMLWSEWSGFAYGIIVEIAATSMMGKLRVPISLGLVLYDDLTGLVYLDGNIPVITDFSPDELMLVRKPIGKGNFLVTHS